MHRFYFHFQGLPSIDRILCRCIDFPFVYICFSSKNFKYICHTRSSITIIRDLVTPFVTCVVCVGSAILCQSLCLNCVNYFIFYAEWHLFFFSIYVHDILMLFLLYIRIVMFAHSTSACRSNNLQIDVYKMVNNFDSFELSLIMTVAIWFPVLILFL